MHLCIKLRRSLSCCTRKYQFISTELWTTNSAGWILLTITFTGCPITIVMIRSSSSVGCETRTHQEMRWRTWTFTQCARKLPELAEITQNYTIMPFKVTDFGTNRKLIYDFLLVINTNLPPILHRLRYIAVDRSEIAILGYPSCV